MNTLKKILLRRNSGSFQIMMAVIWASAMIVTSLLVDNTQISDFLGTMYIAAWVVTGIPEHKMAKTK